MWALKIIPALFSVWLWTKTLKPTHVVDVVEVKTMFVEAPTIWPTITVTKTVGVPTTQVEPTVPLVTITTTASAVFKDTPNPLPPSPKAFLQPFAFPPSSKPASLGFAYLLSSLAAPRYSVLDLVASSFLSFITIWLLCRFPLLTHIQCIREVAIQIRNLTFVGIVCAVKQTCQYVEEYVDRTVWYHGHQNLLLGLLLCHWGYCTLRILFPCLLIYVVCMMGFLKWSLFKQGVLRNWQIVMALRDWVLRKPRTWYKNREALRRIDKVFERPISKISIVECLFPDIYGCIPYDSTIVQIIMAIVSDFFFFLWHICVIAMDDRRQYWARIVPHTNELVITTLTLLFAYDEEDLAWVGFMECWRRFLRCLRWGFEASLSGAREKCFPALKMFLAAVYFWLPTIRLFKSQQPAAPTCQPREYVMPPRHFIKPLAQDAVLRELRTKYPSIPPRPEWTSDPFVTHFGMKPFPARNSALWEVSPRKRDVPLYPRFS